MNEMMLFIEVCMQIRRGTFVLVTRTLAKQGAA